MSLLKFSKDTPPLRYPQVDCKKAFYEAFRKDPKAVPLGVIPTGVGKTLLIANILIDAVNGDRSALVITHTKELVGQNAAEFCQSVDRFVQVGVCCGGHGEFDVTSKIIFASIQTVANRLDIIRAFDIVIIDECHRIGLDEFTQYQTLVSALLEKNAKTRFCGLTATPFRMGQGYLTDPFRDSKTKEPKQSFFTEICYEALIVDMLSAGFLCPLKTITPTGIQPSIEWDSDSYKWESVFEYACDDINQHVTAHNRRRTLIFVSSTEQCYFVKERIENCYILSSTVKEDLNRKGILKWFSQDSDDHRVIVSMGILTTGFNQKDIDGIVTLLATNSVNKWVQIVGRGLRLHEKKKYCLVLDYGKHVERLGTIDNLKIKQAGNGEIILKFCPHDRGGCGSQNFPSAKVCWSCNRKFETKQDMEKYETVASHQKIIEQENHPFVRQVDLIVFDKYEGRNGKKDGISVSYWCNDSMVITEYFPVLSEKEHYAKKSKLNLKKFFKRANDFWELMNDVECGVFEKNMLNLCRFLNENREEFLINVRNVLLIKNLKSNFNDLININVRESDYE